MNERILAWKNRIVDWWKAQSIAARLRWAGLLAFALTLIVVGVGMLTSPNWQPLYTSLNPRTAGQITSQLTQMKVPYELANQGRTILVPKKNVDQVRVDLASQNIPSSGTMGLPSSTPNFTLGETTQEIQMTQLATLEATLQQTINSINGVHGSRVMINQPPPSLFGESTSKPTASVFVDLNPGVTLTPGQVRGIINLVAHSVAGLSAQQVSVVNQQGQVLSAGVLSNSPAAKIAGMSSAQLADETAVDSSVRNTVQSMLDQVLGPGQAVVQVHAVVNFNQSTVTSTKYGKGVLSSQQVQTSLSSQKAAAAAAAGAGKNIPIYPNVTGTGPSSSNQKTTISNFLVDTTKTQQTIPPGAIQSMTVGVVVNKRLSAAQAASLKNLVASASGANAAKVTVMGQPFNRAAVNAAMAAMNKAQQAQRIRQWVMGGVAGLLGLGLLIWLMRWAKRRRPARLTPQPAGIDEPVARLSVADLLQEIQEAKEPSLSEVAKGHLDQLVKSDPEGVARLIRAWMQEDGA